MYVMAIGVPGGPARICEFSNIDHLPAKIRAGEVAIPVEAGAEGRISDDGVSFVPHVPGLDELRRDRREQAKRVRRKRTGQGVMLPGFGRVQTDSGPLRDSLGAIARAAARAARHLDDETWSIDWKLADNSSVLLNAAQMVALGDLTDDHEQACRAAAEPILAAIEAAPDAAALAAIDINAGYPAQPE